MLTTPKLSPRPLALVVSGLLVLSSHLLSGAEPPKASLVGVDNFEDGGRIAEAQWTTVTDKVAGGNSTVEANVVPDGAQGSKHAYRISGEVGNGFQYPFAGATVAHPAKDLHDFAGVTFHVRGDGKPYVLQVNVASVKDHNDFNAGFVAPKEWTQVRIEFKDLKQNPYWGERVPWTGADVQGLTFRSGNAGKFQIDIDDVAYFK